MAATLNALRHTERTVTPMDTSPGARDAYYQRLAEMTPAERLAIGIALCHAGDALQRSAIRRMDPKADDAEITFRIAVTRFGIDLARKAYGRE